MLRKAILFAWAQPDSRWCGSGGRSVRKRAGGSQGGQQKARLGFPEAGFERQSGRLRRRGLPRAGKEITGGKQLVGERRHWGLRLHGCQERLMFGNFSAEKFDFAFPFGSGDFFLRNDLQENKCKAVDEGRYKDQAGKAVSGPPCFLP